MLGFTLYLVNLYPMTTTPISLVIYLYFPVYLVSPEIQVI